MKLSIVIVNWNSRKLLRQCLLSIDANCAGLKPQVVVVDGGSFDGCGEMLRAEFPTVDFVQSEVNLGFAGSNNLGFESVTGDALILLNPDTEIRGEAIQRLLVQLERLPQAGIVSPRLLNSDLSLQCSVHALPRPIRQALDSDLLRRILSRFSCWAPPSEFAPLEPVAVEAVAGTCMLMWVRTFREVGGFSSDYFMYAEDMDLCLKVRRAGLQIYHVPDAEVLHHGGCSSLVQSSKFSAVMIRDALHTYLRLNQGPLAAMIYRLATACVGVLRLGLMVPMFLLSNGESRRTLLASIHRWQSVVLWSLGFERWTKKYVASDRAPQY